MIVNGKVVIITGSGQGLGKAFAQKLLEAGAKVSNSKSKISSVIRQDFLGLSL